MKSDFVMVSDSLLEWVVVDDDDDVLPGVGGKNNMSPLAPFLRSRVGMKSNLYKEMPLRTASFHRFQRYDE
jgi:hypothetical protein